jgi:3-oxoacid CoA-transferase subunit A
VSVRKIYSTAAIALADVLRDEMTIMSGGFGLCGIPSVLIDAVLESGVKGLTIISNNPGAEGLGLGKLFNTRQVRKLICSYAGENAQFARQYMAGEVEVEFNPQGTLAERIRAGGAGIPAFYTRTGVGTVIATGKPLAEFDGKTYLMERGLRPIWPDPRLEGDTEGNLVYRMTARNFNPMMASAAATWLPRSSMWSSPARSTRITSSRRGFCGPHRGAGQVDKRIEQRTVRRRVAAVEE